MDDITNVVNDTPQAVVEPASKPEIENSGTETETSDDGAKVGVASHVQSKAENRAAATMRRAKETAEAQNHLLLDGLKKLGYSGETPQDILDAISAKTNNTTVEEIRRQRAETSKAVENDPRFKAMEQRMIEVGIAEDLKKIQEIDPSVKSVEDLDIKFFTLRKNGIDAKTAYLAIKGSEAPSPKPTDIGSVGSAAGTDDGYFTSEQLDKLTLKDLEDPRVFEKAMKSTKRL